ncbi:hypothetical protein D3C75_224060 [compost metagenome]
MGQGTESCGGYEVDDDVYEDGLGDGMWVQRGGSPIHVSKMTVSHMRNAQRLCRQQSACATFTDEARKWDEWVELFEDEISTRSFGVPKAPLKAVTAPKAKPRGTMVWMVCHCKQEYQARQADLNRKQGLSCSKRCAAIRREFGRPAATKRKEQ